MMNTSQWESGDRRESPRVRAQLRLAVVYPQHEGGPAKPIYHGSTHDICMSGLSLVVDGNVFHDGEVTLLLALPSDDTRASQKIVTATAAMTYAIHSSKLNAFKIGMTFLEFKADGKELLEAALRQALKEDGGVRKQDPGVGFRANRPIDGQPLGQ